MFGSNFVQNTVIICYIFKHFRWYVYVTARRVIGNASFPLQNTCSIEWYALVSSFLKTQLYIDTLSQEIYKTLNQDWISAFNSWNLIASLHSSLVHLNYTCVYCIYSSLLKFINFLENSSLEHYFCKPYSIKNHIKQSFNNESHLGWRTHRVLRTQISEKVKMHSIPFSKWYSSSYLTESNKALITCFRVFERFCVPCIIIYF